MATSSTVNTRALKDEVAELLRKSKFAEATEVLERLARAEPKEMTHRLKLGDTYRRLAQTQKSIAAYQHAAKFFGDEGQLIKAIGAVKIILELDPKNAEAQAQLGEMNQRRLGKVTLESAGLRAPKAIGGGARATSAIELDDASAAASAVSSVMQMELDVGDDDEPLELDDGKPARRGVAPGGGPVLKKKPPQDRVPGPPPKIRPTFDLGVDTPIDVSVVTPQMPQPGKPPGATARPAKATAPIEFDPEDLVDTEAMPIELDPSELVSLDEPMPAPKAAPKPVVAAPRAPPPVAKKPEAPSSITVSDEIDFEDEDDDVPAPKAAASSLKAAPIADLLSAGAEEEVELLSIASDEEVLGERPMANARLTPDEADLDTAFGNISPQAKAAPKKVPAKKVPLFDDLTQDAFVELVNKLDYHRQVPGQLIIREGDPGRSFYVIVEGRVRIYKTGEDGKEITLAHLGEGAFFGEMALLSGAPRAANVVAEEDTELLEVTDVVLRELAAKHPPVVNSLKTFYRQRLLNNVMAISPLFKDFDPQERKAIAEKFRMKQAAPNEVMITEGKSSDGLYVVLHGS
ncbi:MAG TPA: cyclic nucleotide-binding domain-containing protein, partial [Myxococcales bacterium]|nr:cyclic nucleotide-binding domain-containing protein [Myxococcales bacterium]